MDKLIPIEDLFDLIDEEPLEGAKEARKRGKGVRLLNWETGASAFALARRYAREPKLLSAFYSQEFWDDGYEKDPAYLLRHCCQFVIGERKGSEAKRVENWASAMQPTFDETTTTPEKLLEMLKKGGFDGLRKAAAPPTPLSLPQPKASTLPIYGDDHKESGPEEDETPRQKASTKSGDPPNPRHPKLTSSKVFEHLLVALDPHELDRFLADESEVGDTFRLIVQRDPDDASGLLVWRAVNIGKVHKAG